jgi:SAM-dependent methyltransferase
LADTVGDDGRVMATDIDTRFLVDMPSNVIVREHDIASDTLPAEHFDLVHARAVLQHVPKREHALQRMIDATKPGGWLVIEDIDWLVFDSQDLPEPFATLHHTVRNAYTANAGYDGEWGRRMLATMHGAGLLDVESRGTVTTMHGGTPSAEWYVMALERAGPALVEAGLLHQAIVDTAIAQARGPDFAVLSPLSISAWGRKPA